MSDLTNDFFAKNNAMKVWIKYWQKFQVNGLLTFC